jgi:eukaryotic-like serine/threonine-protein kinase
MNDPPKSDVMIFTEALRLPVQERAAYLDRACGGDAKLRQQIEALLQTQAGVGDFLEQSPQKVTLQTRLGASAGEKPGDHIGRFKLLEQIGEGGCGIVFMAEQEEPVRRQVALKIIKPGMDTKSVIARFEAERQTLALMDHPNIAKIIDAGATETGRPYFVMELVRGVKITEYCDQHSLRTEERLKLFVQVCQAIQHAHQKGIIHRDIKPSNILVTTTLEGAGLPVVIDFGIAKATTNQRLTDKTLFTALEMLIGTPAYMSPEQAGLASTDIDTRTDIYSLGVLLYELLAGSTPFDTGELLKAGLDEIRRVIREQEPVRPSTRLSKLTDADLTIVAQRRHADAPKLIRAVRGDLDWIAMKALEKDRTRRYETANDMALDVQHYLANEPVSARPPSRLYKLQKAVLRNKLLFIGIGVFGLLVVVSLIVVSVALARERRSSVKSQQATKFLEDILNGVGPSFALGRDTTVVREILDQTADRLGKEMSNQPAVEAEFGALIGGLFREIGKFDRAEEMDRAALAIRRRQFGSDSPEAAASLNELGLALMSKSKLSEAEAADGEALAIRRRLFGKESALTARSMNDLSCVYREEGRLTEAEPMAREALAIRQRLFGNENLDVADSLRNLCIILGDRGQLAESESMAREVLAIRRKKLRVPDHPEIASALDDVAWAAGRRGKLEEAESLEREALAMRQKLLDPEHPDVAKSLYRVGDRMRQRGNLNESYPVLSAALSMQRKLLGEDSPDVLYTLDSLGLAFAGEGKWPEAEAVHREEVAAWRKRAGNEDPETLFRLRRLGFALEAEGKWPEAEAVWRESLAAWRKRGGNEEPQSMYTLRKLGSALQAEGRWPEAEAVFRESLAVSRKQVGNEGHEALVDLASLDSVLTLQKKFGETEQLLGEVLTSAFVSRPSSLYLQIQRVDLMGRQGRWQEATADAVLILKVEPTESFNYHRLAGLLAITQDRPAFEQICQRFLTNFANPKNPYVAERMAQDCLLLPHSGADLALVDKLADVAVTLGSSEASLPYFQACKAMSNYRLGRFPEAIEWAEKVTKSSLVEAQAKAFAVLAMAHWQLGQRDIARAMLAKGDTLAPSIQPARGAADIGESWVPWIFARVSLDEATGLIQSGSTTEHNSNKP